MCSYGCKCICYLNNVGAGQENDNCIGLKLAKTFASHLVSLCTRCKIGITLNKTYTFIFGYDLPFVCNWLLKAWPDALNRPYIFNSSQRHISCNSLLLHVILHGSLLSLLSNILKKANMPLQKRGRATGLLKEVLFIKFPYIHSYVKIPL